MDGEAEPREAADIERHVADCVECQNCIAEFRKVSRLFDEYGEAMAGESERMAARRWAPVLCGVAAVAAGLVALVLTLPKAKVVQPETPRATLNVSVAGGNAAISGPVSTTAKKETPSTVGEIGHSAQRQTIRAHRGSGERVGWRTASSPDCSRQGCVPIQTSRGVADSESSEAAIQIAIPAEAMFPPGAMPEGVTFVADVSIGADGSVEQLRLRPRLVRFERGAN
jgi:hypothetical protein